jgi:hypothetical protein
MHKPLKWAKLILVLALTFNLFGCGTSEQGKVDSEKKEKIEQVKKKDTEADKKEKLNKEENTKEASSLDEAKKDSSPTVESAKKDSNINSNTVENSGNTTTSNNQSASQEPKKIPDSNSQTVTSNSNQTNSGASSSNQTPSASNNSTTTQQTDPESAKVNVTISITGNGTILGETQESVEEGAKVFDVLLQATKKKNVVVNYNKTSMGIEVIGIDGINKSGSNGWIYKVNGVLKMQGAGAVKVNNGDRIAWSYTNNP